MPFEDHEERSRIREGLKFLTMANRTAIEAAVLLQKLAGEQDPLAEHESLERYHFTVASERFHGRMTQEQGEHLKKYEEKSPKEFADALAEVLLRSNHAVVAALKALDGGFLPPVEKEAADVSSAASSSAILGPTLGCCQYDTGLEQGGVTQSYCEVGLQGSWMAGPCAQRPATEAKAEGGRMKDEGRKKTRKQKKP